MRKKSESLCSHVLLLLTPCKKNKNKQQKTQSFQTENIELLLVALLEHRNHSFYGESSDAFFSALRLYLSYIFNCIYTF